MDSFQQTLLSPFQDPEKQHAEVKSEGLLEGRLEIHLGWVEVSPRYQCKTKGFYLALLKRDPSEPRRNLKQQKKDLKIYEPQDYTQSMQTVDGRPGADPGKMFTMSCLVEWKQ